MQTFGLGDITINVCSVERTDYACLSVRSIVEHCSPESTLQLVFNGSTPEHSDRVIAAARGWDGNLRVEHIANKVGPHASHNRALELVDTPLVNFMGDDDLVLGDRLPEIIRVFNETHPQPAAVTSWARRLGPRADTVVLGSPKDLGPLDLAAWRSAVDRGRYFELLWPGAVIDVEALREIGGFEDRFLSFDNRIFTRLAQQRPVLAVPRRDFGFRIHAESESTSRFGKQAQSVRYVQACLDADRAGRREPTPAEFEQAEASADRLTRIAIDRRERARLHLRSAGAHLLGGNRRAAAAGLARAAILWPPAVIRWIKDQVGRPTRR